MFKCQSEKDKIIKYPIERKKKEIDLKSIL